MAAAESAFFHGIPDLQHAFSGIDFAAPAGFVFHHHFVNGHAIHAPMQQVAGRIDRERQLYRFFAAIAFSFFYHKSTTDREKGLTPAISVFHRYQKGKSVGVIRQCFVEEKLQFFRHGKINGNTTT